MKFEKKPNGRTDRSDRKSVEAVNEDGALRAPLLDAAIEAAELVLGFVHPADGVLSHFFRDNKTGSRDRAFIAELVYGIVRRRRSLSRLASHV